MNLLSQSRVRRGQRAKFILKKAGSTCSLDATRSLSETAKSNACRTISKPAFNRRSSLVRFKCRVMGSRCEPGKYSSVEATAHFRYERGDNLAGIVCRRTLYNEEANLPILQEELRVALSGLDYE